MGHEQVKVFVVDDDPSVLRSLERMFVQEGYAVEGFSHPRQQLEREPYRGPGCMVMDLRMPGLNGLELQRELRRVGWPQPIIFISGHGDVPTAVRAMREGAVDFLLKPFTNEELLKAVERALEQDRLRLSENTEREQLRLRISRLTPREQQVCQQVAAGRSDKQIAAELGTTAQTVGVQRRQVMEKLEAQSVAELARLMARLDAMR